MWLCNCECGNTAIVKQDRLITHHTQSCGCLKKESLLKMNTKHGKYNTRVYKIYDAMKQRCYNPNNISYKYYGDKNITICKEWLNNFMNFYNWAITNGYDDTLSIDRINVDGNYEPSNCRWATAIEQANNKSNNKKRVH